MRLTLLSQTIATSQYFLDVVPLQIDACIQSAA